MRVSLTGVLDGQVRGSLAALAAHYDADPDLARARSRATRLVPGVGSPRPLVVLVGEAPGEQEDRVGQPFVGRSGALLDALLAEHGIDRLGRCYTTNLVKYRPPGNADPGPWEIEVSLSYLRREIAILCPPLVATLGRVSTRALWPTMPRITECHGRPRPLWDGVTHLPMLHPAFGLRPGNREAFAADVATLAGFVGGIS